MALTQIKKLALPKSEVNIFYREQSPSSTSRVLLLLHGYPSSSFQYRNLIPLLATQLRVIAPDLPGFGFTETPATFTYSFRTITETIAELLEVLGISRYSVYIFDYGAPVALRLALSNPDATEAIISQNGNAYSDGFGDAWAPLQEFWASQNTAEDRLKLAGVMLNYEMTKFRYENGTPSSKTISPESYTLDAALLERSGNKDIQLD